MGSGEKMELEGTQSTRGGPPDPHGPQYASPGADRVAAEPTGRLDPLDKRHVFKQMVVGSLESGFLRYSKRKALLAYAAKIGISEFDAMLLIAEAQFYADRIAPAAADGSWLLAEPPHIEVWSAATRLLLAVGVAAMLDAALLYWLLA